VECGLAMPERPRTRLLVPRREERDQVEPLRQPAHDLAERGLAAPAELGRRLGVKARKLGLELKIDPLRPIHNLEQRLRRERLELRRQLALPLSKRVACVEMREQPLEVRNLGPQPRVSRL